MNRDDGKLLGSARTGHEFRAHFIGEAMRIVSWWDARGEWIPSIPQDSLPPDAVETLRGVLNDHAHGRVNP
jgi:hypothetical protein